MDRSRYDSAMYWLPFGTAAAVIGLALMTIGVTRLSAAESPFNSAWFDGGLALLGIGVLLLLWSLWLFVAHRRRHASALANGAPSSASEPPAVNTEAEAVRGYYREREKLLDEGMRIWKDQERAGRRKPKR